MKKVILIVVLSILTLSFLALIINAYGLQKAYFESKDEKNNNSDSAIVIDNRPSLYKDYSKEDYDMALAEKRVLVLYFTSNWCQECQKQDKVNNELFNELTSEGVVGLKIHVLDSETTTETDALAKKFDVIKEQTFVVLNKSGAVSFKYTGILDSDMLKQKIMEMR